MKTHKPKTIKEAIDDLQIFFECDIYSKFRPREILNGEVWTRDDPIKNENELGEYLKEHFDILRKQVKKLNDDKDSFCEHSI